MRMRKPIQKRSQNHQNLLQIASSSPVFRLAVQGAFNHIVITDVEGTIVYANSAVERITGYAPEEVVGKTPRIWGGLMPKTFYKRLWNTIPVKETPFSGEIRNRRKDGREYIAKTVISPIHDGRGNLVGFIGTEEDITREKELERMKTEFVNLAAHQLRTPLTAIGWNIDLLRDPKTNLRGRTWALDAIDSLTDQLIGLVNSLLNIARVENGRISVYPKRIRLQTVIDEALGAMKAQAWERSIVIAVTNDVDDVVHADPSHLLEIMTNLLSNAVKFSPDGATVEITVRADASSVSVSVADRGVGIPKGEQAHVFEKFFRASTAAETQGNGLGLYFVKLLVDISQGTVSLQNAVGKGTTFTVTLPRKGPKRRKGEVGIGHVPGV